MSIYTKIENFYKNNYWRTIFILIAMITLSIILSAFVIDYILEFDPCVLCIYARIPYFLIFILSCIGYKYLNIKKVILTLLLLVSFSGLIIAVYHTGVERSWWQSSFNCSPSIRLSENTNLDDFLHQLDNAEIGDCSRPAFYIMGLSLAEANIVLNFMLIILFTKLLRENDKAYI